MPLLIVYWLLFVVGAVGSVGALGASATLLRRVRPLGGATFVPLTGASLSMIVPIRGADVSTEANLNALVESQFRGEIEYLFAMESADDPAYAVCQRVRALHPDRDIRVVFSGPAGARMGKQHNLAAAVRAARYAVVGSMDADVSVAPTTLAVGLSYLAQPGAGIVYFFPGYTDQPPLGRGWPLGGALVALYSDYYFLANFGALALTRPQPAIIGGLWLVRRATLEAIGGLDQFTRVVSAMLRAEGLSGYLTILATWHPIFWSALALIVGLFTPTHQWLPSLLLLGAAIVVRVLTALLLNLRVYRLPPLPLPLLAVVYELVGVPLLFGAGLFRRTIVWKGRRYRLGRHGVIRQAW